MSKPAPPEPVDPYEAAEAQTGTNVSTSLANTALGLVDQITPYGNLTYDQTGTYTFVDPNSGVEYELPTYTATTELTPIGQATLNQQNLANYELSELAAQQAAYLGDYLATEGPAAPTLVTDYSDEYAGEVYDAAMSRVTPQMDQQYDDLTAQLVAQGLEPGTEAFDRQMSLYYQGVNDMQTQAWLASQSAAAQQASFENDALLSQYEADLAARGQPINEITALLSGAQVAVPQFDVATPAGIPTTDIAGYMYQTSAQEQAAYEAQLAAATSMWNGLFGFAGDIWPG